MENFNIAAEMNELNAKVPNIVSYANMMGTEDMSSVLKTIQEGMTKRIGTIKGLFSTTDSRIKKIDRKEVSEQAKRTIRLDKDVAKIMKNVSFADVEKKLIPVTMGLDISLYDLILDANPILNGLHKEISDALDTTDTIISKVLADADYRKKIKPPKQFKDIQTKSGDIHEFISTAINANNRTDRLEVGKLIPNISQLESMRTSLVSINRMITQKDIEQFEKKIKVIAEKTDLLHTLLVENKDSIEISKQSILELAHILEVSAKFTTNVVSLFYLIGQTNDMFNKLVQTIK